MKTDLLWKYNENEQPIFLKHGKNFQEYLFLKNNNFW